VFFVDKTQGQNSYVKSALWALFVSAVVTDKLFLTRCQKAVVRNPSFQTCNTINFKPNNLTAIYHHAYFVN